MNFFRKAWLISRFLGPGWVAFRLRYAMALRSGAMKRRTPLLDWPEVRAEPYLPTWLQSAAFPESGRSWSARCIAEADGVALGEFVLFSYHLKQLGSPPNWHKNAFTGQSAPRGVHWSELGDFDFGDIKAIWEPSRFGWAFTLARAHARTKEARLAELFWKLFENWCQQNPPNTGVNWKCGQESTFRLMAAAFAMGQFGFVAEATAERLQLWSRFVKATGWRIAANIEYALSQSNNHGISESIGLITAGLLSPEDTETRGWREAGWRHLREQLDDLVYADGGFSQHSLIYHRVLLHDLYWIISLCRKSNTAVPEWLLHKTRVAKKFFQNLVDETTGGAPLYGANDGALILPLDDGAFDDFRNVVQTGNALLGEAPAYPPGSWDESVFWLTRMPRWEDAVIPLMPANRWYAPQAGCFQWISHQTRLFLRCPTHFRHRPGQADMLHADVWWRGYAIAQDAGSYSNNAPPPMDGALAKAEAHNVAMVAGREPLQKVGRFLFLPWPKGTVVNSASSPQFQATHDAYGQEVQIERRISNPRPDVFTVTDVIGTAQPTRIRVHWLLADADWRLDKRNKQVTAIILGQSYAISWSSLTAETAVSLVRADPASARGWRSRHYLAAEPAVSLELLFDANGLLEVNTQFQPVMA